MAGVWVHTLLLTSDLSPVSITPQLSSPELELELDPACKHCHAVMTHDLLGDQVLRRDLWCQCPALKKALFLLLQGESHPTELKFAYTVR